MDAREGELESGKRLIVFVMLIWLESMSRVTGIIRQREREREQVLGIYSITLSFISQFAWLTVAGFVNQSELN